jgi:hypothetical protein
VFVSPLGQLVQEIRMCSESDSKRVSTQCQSSFEVVATGGTDGQVEVV